MRELSEDEAELVVRALQHYSAYLHAALRDDGRYQELAERLQRKPPGKEQPEPAAKKRRA
jgi:hypothetical protein